MEPALALDGMLDDLVVDPADADADAPPPAAPAAAPDANDYSRFDALDDPDDEDDVDRARALKDEGNRAFQAADFEGAVRKYGEVCALCKFSDGAGKARDPSDDACVLRVAALANRAACRLKLRRFGKAIEDCDQVLAQQPAHAKALFRRATAHKAKGLNELAYRDVLLLLDVDGEAGNKRALKEKRRLEKELHARSRDAIRGRIDREKREAADKEREAAEKKRKAKMKAAEEKRRKAALADNKVPGCADGGGAAPVPVVGVGGVRKSKGGDVVQAQGADGLMKGYKKTKDGKTTSYFTRELDEGAAELIGNVTPQKIVAGASAAAAGAGAAGDGGGGGQDGGQGGGGEGGAGGGSVRAGSAWNRAGTWEEVDKTSWCKEQLHEWLREIKVLQGGDVPFTCAVTDVKQLEGDGSLLMARGKLRFLFDFSFKLKWAVKLTASGKTLKGTLAYMDFTQDPNEPPSITSKTLGPGWRDANEQGVGKRAVAMLRGQVERALAGFREECKKELGLAQ